MAQTRSQPVADRGMEVAWGVLAEGVQDGTSRRRQTALTALSTIESNTRAVDLAAKALKNDKDPLVRQAAAAALGDMRSSAALPALREALDDGPAVSFTAAKSLWMLGDQGSSREVFWEVISGERKNTPSFMQSALREAKRHLKPEELAFTGAKEAAGFFGPAEIGVIAVQEALRAAKNGKGAPGRVISAEVLADDTDPYSLTVLEWALDDDSTAVRTAVAKALGKRGNRSSIPRLQARLADEHHEVRYMAAAAMIRLNAKA